MDKDIEDKMLRERSRHGFGCHRIDRAADLLQSLLDQSEADVRAVGEEFERLTTQVSKVLQIVSAIVDCVDNESVRAVLPQVQALGRAAREFIHDRQQAIGEIGDIIAAEAKLLEKLAQVAQGQRSVARQTSFLSVVTSIEVANLGQLGAGFQYLAHELDGFSREVVEGSDEVASQTERRRVEVQEAKRKLSFALPRMQTDFSRIEIDLGKALADMNEAIDALSSHPVHLRECVQAIASQVSSVVAAVQSQDITRQQIEHVRDALRLVCRELESDNEESHPEESRSAAILAIQMQQLKNIRDTTEAWVSQIDLCLDSIQQISSSEMVTIGSLILEQDRMLSAQMQRIEALEQESQDGDTALHNSLGDLGELMQLVSGHLENSKLARDRMQMLNFNSMIEARHLGSRGAVMVEISQNIRRVSGDWSEMTARSNAAVNEVADVVKHADEGLKASSTASRETLRGAQSTTEIALRSLQAAAESATGNGIKLRQAVTELQTGMAAIRKTADRLDTGMKLLASAMDEVEEIERQISKEIPREQWTCNMQELEDMLSVTYTTEIERHILRAALYGEAIPEQSVSLVGNDVELF